MFLTADMWSRAEVMHGAMSRGLTAIVGMGGMARLVGMVGIIGMVGMDGVRCFVEAEGIRCRRRRCLSSPDPSRSNELSSQARVARFANPTTASYGGLMSRGL